MKSENSCKPIDLSRDLPTRREDVLALKEARKPPRLGFEEYLSFLAQFPEPSAGELRTRKGPRGEKPFEL